ncbi:MAG: hypothetical protein JW781_11090 [Deltaproteobacteria bacterium]|nr:hypothetical protein [Candidatus Anaeroferrophillacea bacterium]
MSVKDTEKQREVFCVVRGRIYRGVLPGVPETVRTLDLVNNLNRFQTLFSGGSLLPGHLPLQNVEIVLPGGGRWTAPEIMLRAADILFLYDNYPHLGDVLERQRAEKADTLGGEQASGFAVSRLRVLIPRSEGAFYELVGCGRGRVKQLMSRRFWALTGVDIRDVSGGADGIRVRDMGHRPFVAVNGSMIESYQLEDSDR